MTKITCNVIKDLLPSYLEHICSEDTNNLVKEHLKECVSCKNYVTSMSETIFSSDKAEMQTIDYMKKVNRQFRHKNILLFSLLLLFLVGGMTVVISNIHRDTALSARFYHIAMPILLLAMHDTLSNYAVKKGNKRWQFLIGGIGTIGIIYSIILSYACIRWVQNRQYPVDASKMGPFVSNQFLAVAILELILFLCTCIISLKKQEHCGIPMTIHLTGCFLNLSLIYVLHRLDTFEKFAAMFGFTMISFMVEGILMAALLRFLEKR